MHQSFVTTAPPTYGDGRGDSGANVLGSDQACDITQIYTLGIYYYKEQGQVPAVQDF